MASIADVYVDLLPRLAKSDVARELAKIKDVKINVGAKVVARQVKDEFDKVKGAKVKVDAKADPRQVKEEFGKIKNVKVNVEAKAKADQVKEEFARFKGVKVPVEPKLDKGAAAAALTGLAAASRGQDVKLKAKVDKPSVAKAKREMISSIGERGFLDNFSIPFRAKIPLPVAIEAIGAAPSIVPLIGSMVKSVGQLSGALGLIPAVAGTAGLAIGSLKIATAGFSDALKEIRDPEKFAEAIAAISPNMQGVARDIQTLLPQIDQLKFTVQDAFGAGFADQVKGLGSTLLPVFTDIMSRMSQSAGITLGGIGKMLQTPEMVSDIKTFGSNASQAFSNLLQAVQPLVKAFTDIATVGSDFLPDLAIAASDLAKKFGDFIGEARESGKLAEWIQGGIEALTQLKDIAFNTWNIFKGIFEAAGGGDFLDTIVNLTTTWSNWVNSIEGQNSLRDFFDEAKRTIADLWPIIRDLGTALFNAFMGAKQVLDEILPLLQTISRFLAEHEGLVFAVGVAFGSWKLASIISDIAKIGGALLGLQATAATAGTGIRTGLLAGLGAGGVLGTLTINLAVAGGALAIWAGEKLLGAGKSITLPVGDVGVPQPIVSDNASVTRIRPGAQAARRGAPGQFGAGGVNQLPTVPSPHPGLAPAVPRTPPSPNALPDVSQQPAPVISNYPGPSPSAGSGGAGAGSGGANAPKPVAGAGYTGFGEPDWEAIAEAESGGNWQMATGNGYFGGLQILPATWEANGGPPGTTANMFSKEDQITVAENILQSQGPGAWPDTFKWKESGSGGRGSGSGAGFNTASGLGQTFPQSRFSDVGLQPNAARLNDVVAALFPDVTNIGGYEKRPAGTPQMHTKGRALDINVPNWQSEQGKSFGDQINTFLRENAEALGVESTIWRDIWKDFKGNQSVVKGHQNHIHVQVKGGPAAAGPLTTDMQQWPGYDGPGLNRDNPMYVQPAKEATGGEQLGQDILAGIGEIFGFGDIFKDPTQFGLFKIFKAFMGLTTKEGGGQGGEGQGGQGGLLGLLGSLTKQPLGQPHHGGPAQPGQFVGGGNASVSGLLGSIIPQPFGQLNTAGETNAPGQFQPLMPQPGGGGVVLPGNIMATPFSPTGPGSVAGPGNAPVNFDQRTIFNGPVGNVREQTDAWQGADGARFRQGMKAVPVRPA